MLQFLRKNGFPVDLEIYSGNAESEDFYTHAVMIDGKEGPVFTTTEFTARKYWAMGFWEGLKVGQKGENYDAKKSH